ncbi:hypothetical protein PVAND_017446 [Polypedilum vanderplanki]|uniref:Ankyrin repeat protein n=1 Tax=Polypedilum vanderplanki TaxID=319348 RepID=A0A9J6BJ26_POLVA|nr:hypothetical protein PVAND_017446 [Polypedilum vanderplanki]
MANLKLMSWCMMNNRDDAKIPSILRKDFTKKKPEKYLNYLDKFDRNLLIIAIECGSNKKVKELLIFGFDPDNSFKGKSAVSLAYENKNFDIVLTLLENNSKFPRNFNVDEIEHEGLKKFIEITREFHSKITKFDEITLEEILHYKSLYPNCKQFYGLNGEFFNRSIAYVALSYQKFDLYESLKKQKITATCEELKWIYSEENKDENSTGVFFNRISFSSEKLPDTLFTKSHIGHNLENTEETIRYNKVIRTFRYLNNIPEISALLKYLTKVDDYKIFFDFSRVHKKISNIRKTQDVTKYIYIGAKKLLQYESDKECLKIYGIIIKELCRFAIEQIYNNLGKPFENSSKDEKKEFLEAFNECKKNSTQEPLINAVFNSKYEHSKEAELIATIPQIITVYSQNQSRLKILKTIYGKIFTFFEMYTVVDAEEALEKNISETENSVMVYLGSIGDERFTKSQKRKLKFFFVSFCCVFVFLIIITIIWKVK